MAALKEGRMTEQLEIPGISEAEMVAWLRGQKWSDFAQSLVEFADSRGFLTASQMTAASRLREKCLSKRQSKASEPVVLPVPGETPVPIGTFTIPHENGHRTMRTVLQPADASFAPGEVIIQFLFGSDNDNDFTGFGFVKGTPGNARLVVWKRFADNEDLAADALRVLSGDPEVLVSKRCMACNRTLTRPSSIHANIGPECAKRYGV